MSEKSLNETAICDQYITPAIHAAGWDKPNAGSANSSAVFLKSMIVGEPLVIFNPKPGQPPVPPELSETPARLSRPKAE